MGYKKTCFNCKKSFNVTLCFNSKRKYSCPDCGQPAIFMSHKFRPPKRTEVAKWQLVEFLADQGFIFHSIFETPSGGAHVKYPANLREAKEFVIKYKEQSINWVKNRNPKTLNKQITQNEIEQLLEEHSSVIINLYETGYSSEYFYGLVSSLTNCLVTEIRPAQTIHIQSDIDTSYLYVHKLDLLDAIVSCNKLKNQVFAAFLKHLNLTDSESVFREITRELRQTIKFNKGTFDDWNYWQHGGDIEFDNKKTEEHINIKMYNRNLYKTGLC